MPLENKNSYRPVFYFLGPHVETIYPFLFRRVQSFPMERERIELPDGDFLDLDWLRTRSTRLLVLCHGLEGSSQSQYMRGMTYAAMRRRIDVMSINFRSCSGEMNRKLRLYHHGEIEDLSFLLQYILDRDSYQSISLCGFSLGGNVVLKYLGTYGNVVPLQIRSAVAISVPCDLVTSSQALDRWSNALYTRRFMRSLKRKFSEKSLLFPGKFDMSEFDRMKSWRQFDNTFTTAVTGFQNADDYYQQGSARYFIPNIRTKTLIINALNDPFLMEPSYPVELCRNHHQVYLETPDYGGHVGFWYPSLEEAYTETRVMQFISEFS